MKAINHQKLIKIYSKNKRASNTPNVSPLSLVRPNLFEYIIRS